MLVPEGHGAMEEAGSSSRAAPFRFVERGIETRNGPRVALVVEPTIQMRLGEERLAALRKQTGWSEVDREIAVAAQSRAGRVQIMLFRGKSAKGEGTWDMDPDMPDASLDELGYRLAKTQLPTYRRLLASGVFMHVHTDLTAHTATALQRGADRLVRELALSGPDAAVRRVDRWIVQHLTFFFTLGTDKVLTDILPDQVPLFEQRLPRIREMVATLPAASIA
jgi:hypothetical protein